MFDRFEPKNRSGENKKAVIASPIIAKAITRKPGGEVYMLVVFQKSTRLEFYWVFRAKSPRSSRRSWKFVAFYSRDFPFDVKPYRDFGSFVEHFCAHNSADVLSQKVMHKKRLSGLLVKAEHDSILANWEPQNSRAIVTDLCRRRAQRARNSRMALTWR